MIVLKQLNLVRKILIKILNKELYPAASRKQQKKYS